MAVAADIAWYNSLTGPGRGNNIGAVLHDTQGTLTSVAAAGDMVLFDSALGGLDGDHDDKYLALIDGNSALYAGRVSRYQTSGGRFILNAPLPSTAAIGDTYRLFPTTDVVFRDATAQECADGSLDHAAIFVRNNHGSEAMNTNSVWVKWLDMGPVRKFEIFVEDDNGDTGFIWAMASAKDGPDQARLDSVDPAGGWSQPLSLAQALLMQPRNSTPQTTATGRRPMFLRRTIDPEARASHAAVMLVFECDDPAVTRLQVPVVLTMDFNGFTPDITAAFDRRAFIGGGARVDVQIDVGETGNPAADIDVGFKLVSPSPGTLTMPSTGTVTDDDGKTYASYAAMNDPGDAGEDVTVEVHV